MNEANISPNEKEFWCDLIENTHSGIPWDFIRSKLPFSPDGSRFQEKVYLSNPNTVNVLLFDAIFRGFTGGLPAPKTVMDSFIDRTTSSDSHLISYQTGINMLMSRTRFILALGKSQQALASARMAYDKMYDECVLNPERTKYNTIKRFADRLVLPQTSASANYLRINSSPPSSYSIAFLTETYDPDSPLHVNYVRLALKITRHNDIVIAPLLRQHSHLVDYSSDTYANQDSKHSSVYLIHTNVMEWMQSYLRTDIRGSYVETHTDDTNIPRNHLLFPPVQTIFDMFDIGESHYVETYMSEREGISKPGRRDHRCSILSVRDFLTHCISQDGYFIKRMLAIPSSDVTSATWLHIANSENSKNSKWWTWWESNIIGSRISHSPCTIMVTHETLKVNDVDNHTDQIALVALVTMNAVWIDLMHSSFSGTKLRLARMNGTTHEQLEKIYESYGDGQVLQQNSRCVSGDIGRINYHRSFREDLRGCRQVYRLWDQLCSYYVKTRLSLEDTREIVAVSEKDRRLQMALSDNLEKTTIFFDFVMKYVHRHDLLNRTWNLRNHTKKEGSVLPLYSVVVIDNRQECSLSLMSLLMALYNIRTDDPRCEWCVHIFCGYSNRYHVREQVEVFLADSPPSHLRITELEELSVQNRFDIDNYSTLLKSSHFWSHLSYCEKCLMIQNDGMIVKPGVERWMHQYDYVGAPWLAGQVSLEKFTNPHLVGNGGISVRSVRAMYEICRNEEEGAPGLSLRRELFLGGAQPVPEDVFFSRGIYLSGDRYRIAPREEAERFSSEQYAHPLGTIAFHKPWPYHSLTDTKRLFEKFLSDSMYMRRVS